MNKYLIIIVFFFSFSVFAQKIEIGNIENQLKTYNYVLNNLEKIKNDNTEEILFITLNFDKNHFIERVSYFSCTEQTMHDENKKEIKVSYELNQFIENTFSFFSKNIFYSKQTGDSSYSFFIPLTKENLKIAIKSIHNQIVNIESSSHKIDIIPNSQFNLAIKDLYFYGKKYNDKTIQDKLNNYNSELIEISPNLYLIFRIIKTYQFNSNIEIDYFEYKIMYLKGTSSELFISNRFELDSNKVEISEIPLTSGNDNLSDSRYCETDEIRYLSRKFVDFKFIIKIEFEK